MGPDIVSFRYSYLLYGIIFKPDSTLCAKNFENRSSTSTSFDRVKSYIDIQLIKELVI